MKRIITVLFATGLLAALATGCKEEYKTYSDAEYVLFADTLNAWMDRSCHGSWPRLCP